MSRPDSSPTRMPLRVQQLEGRPVAQVDRVVVVGGDGRDVEQGRWPRCCFRTPGRCCCRLGATSRSDGSVVDPSGAGGPAEEGAQRPLPSDGRCVAPRRDRTRRGGPARSAGRAATTSSRAVTPHSRLEEGQQAAHVTEVGAGGVLGATPLGTQVRARRSAPRACRRSSLTPATVAGHAPASSTPRRTALDAAPATAGRRLPRRCSRLLAHSAAAGAAGASRRRRGATRPSAAGRPRQRDDLPLGQGSAQRERLDADRGPHRQGRPHHRLGLAQAVARVAPARLSPERGRGPTSPTSSATSAASVTSSASRLRMSSWHPADTMRGHRPGHRRRPTRESLVASAAVLREPERSPASTTTVPRAMRGDEAVAASGTASGWARSPAGPR